MISSMKRPANKFRVDLTVLSPGMQHTFSHPLEINDVSANIVSVTRVNKDWEHLKLALQCYSGRVTQAELVVT